MFVAIMAPNRLRFAADDLLSATKEEEAQAEETYVSYCGRYDFDGDTVIHHVELSLFTNWIGGYQERLVDLGENQLTLSSRPLLLRGVQQTAHLIWERLSTTEREAHCSPGCAEVKTLPCGTYLSFGQVLSLARLSMVPKCSVPRVSPPRVRLA